MTRIGPMQRFVAAGLCGGLPTFSASGIDTRDPRRAGGDATALRNVSPRAAAGVAAVVSGLAVARAI